jgi:hypothetical protein
MQVREAKDFLVEQTAEQAQLEGVPLSDLEKRMMYFTESGYVPEDPIALNEEFEAQYDTQEYEQKLAKLLEHAYKRVSEDSEAKRKIWDDAIDALRAEDHYLLVLWDLTSFSRVPLASLFRLAVRLGLLALITVGAVWGLNYLSGTIGWRTSNLYPALFILLYLGAMLRRDLPKRIMLALVRFLIAPRKWKPRVTRWKLPSFSRGATAKMPHKNGLQPRSVLRFILYYYIIY